MSHNFLSRIRIRSIYIAVKSASFFFLARGFRPAPAIRGDLSPAFRAGELPKDVTGGGSVMRKLITAATVSAFALAMAPAIVEQAQAAPAKSPFCNMAPATTSASWAEFYGCWGGPPRQYQPAQYNPPQYKPAPAQVAYTGPGQTDFCKLSAASNASWAEFYGCWKPHHR
jgi:hypothetical protein